MKMHTATRTRITVDVTTDFDPAGSTVAFRVDGTWHPCTWQGTATQSGTTWRRTAQTDDWFAGPSHTAPAGATVLKIGTHTTATRVATASTGDITAHCDPIEVSST